MPLQTLYYNATAQANAKATGIMYNSNTPAGESILTPTTGVLTTNPTPLINTYFTPMYATIADANAGTNPVAHLSYLQTLSTSGTFTISTNNYSIINDVPAVSGTPDAIQFIVVANKSPFIAGDVYPNSVPNYKTGIYSSVTSVTVSVLTAPNSGIRSYSFNT
jgi:hypothetical protein